MSEGIAIHSANAPLDAAKKVIERQTMKCRNIARSAKYQNRFCHYVNRHLEKQWNQTMFVIVYSIFLLFK